MITIRTKDILNLISIISIFITVLSMITRIVLSFVITYKYPSNDSEELIQNYFDHNMIHIGDTLLILLIGLFLIPAIIGVYLLFKSKIEQKTRNLMIIPTISTILGSIMITSLAILKLIIVGKLAPDYASATVSEQAEILDIFDNRIRLIFIIQAAANMLIFAIGTGSFGVASLKYQVTKETQTWLALLSGVLGLSSFLVLIPGNAGSIFTFLVSIASILFFFWLGGMGFAINERNKEKKLESIEETNEMNS